jgi:hypothetical protein
MKQTEYDIVIDSISKPFGEWPCSVDVHHHIEGGDLPLGARECEQVTRVALPPEVINDDGTHDEDAIYEAVRAQIGETQEAE